MTEETIGDALQKALRRLVIATLVLYLVLTVAGAIGWVIVADQADKLERVTLSTNTALCTLRDDLARRVSESVDFLASHPKGFEDIPAAVIQQSIDNQQRTIDALSNLDCVEAI